MIATETLIGWGATAATIVGHAFVVNYRVGRNEKEIDDIWKWKNSHEKEASDLRSQYQIQLSKLEGGHAVMTEKIQNIMTILEEIKAILMNRKGDLK